MGAYSSAYSSAYDSAPAVPWDPSMPWPGTPGGASSPHWGSHIRLYVRAAIAAGTPWHLGPHADDRLDAGNVLSAGIEEVIPLDVVEGAFSSAYSSAYDVSGEDVAPIDRLWIDLSCDAIDVGIVSGATTSSGILTKAEAATCEVTLADPDGIYDPTNPHTPFSFGGRSRLKPGIPVEVFAEIIDPATHAITTRYLFTGTADLWREDWTPRASTRRATLLATDATKVWARYDRPEQSPIGTGETTAERVERLVSFYGWPGTIEPGPTSATTLAATTLAATGWELLGRTLDDELGMAYFTPEGVLRWTARSEWFDTPEPILDLGCDGIEPDAYDVLTDATPSALDQQMRNVIRAARTGGTTQTASSVASIREFGAYEYQRTDLGVATDSQAATWASDLLAVSAFPRVVLEDVTMRPGIDAASWDLWPLVLGLRYVSDAVRVTWAPPDRPDSVVRAIGRVVGSEHQITRAAWEVTWQLAAADVLAGASVFTLGPHANDRLDAGNVLAAA